MQKIFYGILQIRIGNEELLSSYLCIYKVLNFTSLGFLGGRVEELLYKQRLYFNKLENVLLDKAGLCTHTHKKKVIYEQASLTDLFNTSRLTIVKTTQFLKQQRAAGFHLEKKKRNIKKKSRTA